MASILLPNAFHVKRAQHFTNSFSDTSKAFYLFIGKHVPAQTNNLPDVHDDTIDTDINIYRNMILGKAIANGDVCSVIPNIPYVVANVFAMYDDGDPFIFTRNYFAIVNAGAFSHVWKCLDNNNGNPSQIAPNIADIDITDQEYITSDGYQWKYMYSVDSLTVSQFATQNWFPLIPNTAVQTVSVDGAVDVIQVTSTGEGYNNYLTGTFAAGSIRVNGNSLLYSISDNTTACSLPGFYTGCLLYISSGTGSGGFQSITDSFANSNGAFVVIASQYVTPPQISSQYQIFPEVVVVGDGSQTSNARAMALVNSIGNSVYDVQILQRGGGYKYFVSTNVVSNSAVGILSTANVRAIYGPPGGHGFNPYEELGAVAVSVSPTLIETESNTIPADNQFQQVGILDTPLFANVSVTLSWVNGVPLLGEQGFVLNARLLDNNMVVNQGNNVMVSNNAYSNLLLEYTINDPIYLESGDNTQHQVLHVNSIVNSTYLSFQSPSLWTCTSTQSYLANLTSNFYIQAASSNGWLITNVFPSLESQQTVILTSSGTKAQINVISMAGVNGAFETFVGMFTYTATMITGSFTENETVFAGSTLSNATATAALFTSWANGANVTIWTSNQVGMFNVGNTINGVNSGAVANITAAWSPSIVFGSGRPIYIENKQAIARSNTTNESFNIVLVF